MYCLQCEAFGATQYYSLKGDLTVDSCKAKLYRKRSDAAKGKGSMNKKLKKYSWHTELINITDAVETKTQTIEVINEDIVDMKSSENIIVGAFNENSKAETNEGDELKGNRYGRVVLKNADILNFRTGVTVERVARVAAEIKSLLDDMWGDRDYILKTNEEYNVLENELRHFVEFTKFNVVDGYQMNKLEHDFRESRRKVKDACDIIHKVPAMLRDASKELSDYANMMSNRKFKYTMIDDCKSSEGATKK